MMDALLHLFSPAQEHSLAPSAPPAPLPVPREPVQETPPMGCNLSKKAALVMDPVGRRGATPADYVSGRLAPGTKWQYKVTSFVDDKRKRDARMSLRHTHTELELCDYCLEEGNGVLRPVADNVDRSLLTPERIKSLVSAEGSKLVHRPIHLQDCWLEERESGWERATNPATASPFGDTAKAMRHAASTTIKGRRDMVVCKPRWGAV